MEDTQSPRDILNQALSFQATAGVHEEYARGHTGPTFWKTGFSQCGLVFTVPDQPGVVIKVARPFFGDALQNDYHVHQRIADVFLSPGATLSTISPLPPPEPDRPPKSASKSHKSSRFYDALAGGGKPDPDRFTDPEPNIDTTAAGGYSRIRWKRNLSMFPDSETFQRSNNPSPFAPPPYSPNTSPLSPPPSAPP